MTFLTSQRGTSRLRNISKLFFVPGTMIDFPERSASTPFFATSAGLITELLKMGMPEEAARDSKPVSVGPGQSAVTEMPVPANSLESASAKERT